MDAPTLPADFLALADIGLPGGRSGLSLLDELAEVQHEATVFDASSAADLPGWIGAALDIGGLKPPAGAQPKTA